MTVIIRNRRPEDAEALEAIALETHRLDGYPKYLPGDLRSFIMDGESLAAWIAECDGQVVGHVALHTRSAPELMDVALSATGFEEDGVAMVCRLLVAPTSRRRGTGRRLLDCATHEAIRLGRRAMLDVVDEHRAAIEMYERRGWTRVGCVTWRLPDGRPLREFVYLSPEPEAQVVEVERETG